MRDPVKRRYIYIMIAGFGAISLSIILFFILYRLQGIGEVLDSFVQILSPFIYGGVVAYLLRPLCNGYELILRKRLPKSIKKHAPMLAVLGSIVTMVILIYTLIAMIVPQVYESIITLWSAIPSRVRSFLAWAETAFGEDDRVDVILNYFNTSTTMLYHELETWVRDTVIPQVTTVISGVGSSMFKVLRVVYNLLVGLIVSVYVLYSRKRFARQGTLIVRGLFSQKWADSILNEVSLVDKMFGGFIDAKIADSAIIGILCYLGCLILRMPNTLLVSVFIGVTNIIPFFGPFIGAIPATLLILIEDPLKAVWFVIFVIVLQQLDGNVIGPRIMGNRIGISGFWIMFAIIFFGGAWGVLGMVIGVPLFAVIYDLVKKLVRKGLNSKGHIELWEQYNADFPNEDIQPVTEPVERITDWNKEDWKRHALDLLADFKRFWKSLTIWIVLAWKVIRKICLVVWAFLKKWSLKLWAALKIAYAKTKAFTAKMKKR